MATIAESSGESPNISSSTEGDFHVDNENSLAESTLWIDYAVQQARLAQKNIEDTLDSAISVTRSRLDQIRSTSSAHMNQTIDSLKDVKSIYNAYEDIVFGKIIEGMLLAASHPLVTSGVVVGSGFMLLRRPRRALYYKTMRFFSSEEALFSKAEAKVNGLRQSIHRLEREGENLKNIASRAEEEMKRGKTKLRQTGNQIQGVIRVAYKIEREAAGLKDVLKELPSGTASKFRSEVSNLASVANGERRDLNKVVTKISNYGISV